MIRFLYFIFLQVILERDARPNERLRGSLRLKQQWEGSYRTSFGETLFTFLGQLLGDMWIIWMTIKEKYFPLGGGSSSDSHHQNNATLFSKS